MNHSYTLEILLTPLRSFEFYTILPGPIIARTAVFSQSLLRNVYFALPGSAAEYDAYEW